MQAMIREGVAGVHFEDQLASVKKCGHLGGKVIVPTQEFIAKLVSARLAADVMGVDTLIIARTDAVAVEGFDRAIARAARYREAGADMLFIEAPREHAELGRIAALMGKTAPLMANMVEGGKTPLMPASELQELGFAFVIFPGAIVRVLAKAAEELYGALKTQGSTEAFRPRMFDFEALNRLIGTPEALARGKQYEGLEPAPVRKTEQR